jgi:prevent-host-death family protein
MLTVNTHEAKTHLSRLLARVANGEEIIIAKSGKPIAKLVPIKQKTPKRIPGRDQGEAWISDEFDAPLPAKIQEFFE